MFFIKTFKKFFKEDATFDLYFFIFGLVFLFSFALINMGEWDFLFSLALGIFLSLTFRYITTDEIYAGELKSLRNKSDCLSFILGKNLFSIFLLALFFY